MIDMIYNLRVAIFTPPSSLTSLTSSVSPLKNDRTQFIPVGVYTIVEVKTGKGSTAGRGKLKSGAGWISLDYCKIL